MAVVTIVGTFSYDINRIDKPKTLCEYIGNADFKEKYGIKRFKLLGEELPTTKMQYQFEVEYNEKTKSFKYISHKEFPKGDKAECIEWLSSSIFSGIGPVKAKKIVNALEEKGLIKENYVNEIKENIYLLKEVVSDKDFWKLYYSFEKHYNRLVNRNETYEFLKSELGISEAKCIQIDKIFEDECYECDAKLIDIIKECPYSLYKYGKLPFCDVDTFAFKLGIEKTDPFRLDCGILEVLKFNEAEGHTCIDEKTLIDKVSWKLNLNDDEKEKLKDRINFDLNNELNYANICSYKAEIGEAIMRTEIAIAEITIGNFILEKVLSGNISPIRNNPKYASYSDEYFGRHLDRIIDNNVPNGMMLHTEQRKAIKKALSSGVSCIIGGAGTGKSTLTKIICESYTELNGKNNLTLIAPTGAASRRLSERSGYPAKTIHSQFRLGVDNEEELFVEKQDTQSCFIENSLIIVDEASMLSLEVMKNALEYIDVKTCSVVFIGDINQLPSISAGAVFADILKFFEACYGDSFDNPVSKLTKTYRQGDKSGIIEIAEAVNCGDFESIVSNDEFKVINVLPPINYNSLESYLKLIEDKIVEVFLEEIKQYGLENVMILSPVRKGICGIENINNRIQNAINPVSEKEKVFKSVNGQEFRIGDRVVHLVNRKNVVNGDVGIVDSIEIKRKKLVLTVKYELAEGPYYHDYTQATIDEIELAFAVTIHKSQGSEYKSVIVGINSLKDYGMLQRNLLYTAVTRGKQMVHLISNGEYAVKKAVLSKSKANRNTRLCHLLKYGYENKIVY